MVVNRVVSMDAARSDSELSIHARNYELVSTRPLPLMEIPVTLTLLAFGAKANDRLIDWYSKHRVFLTRLSNTARLVSVVSWFLPLPISRVLVVPLLFCGLIKLVCTMLMLSAPILRMLMSQYEFWFTTVLNSMGMVLFAIQIGPDIRLGYPLLTYMSIQVTICSDADVYSLSETARAGVLSSVCATALGLFALHQSVEFKKLPSSTDKDWSLAQLNFMTNVSLTLAIFIINKSYKRRRVFCQHLTPFVPLAVCRAKLSIFHFRVVPLMCHIVDANRTLWPAICLRRRLTNARFALLTAMGLCGIGLAIISLLLITVYASQDRDVLLPCAGCSLVLTSVYCLTYAAHYQRDLCSLLLRNFDFWFTSMQFISATICLADLLEWDYRCLNILAWMLWFLWALFTDALLPTFKRKLRFKKWHATPVLLAVVLNLTTIAYTLALDNREILHSRTVEMGSLGGFFTMVISTGTFMGYRLATIMLWTCRLTWRLAFHPEAELILLRGAVEYRNPFFQPAYVRTSPPRHDPAIK